MAWIARNAPVLLLGAALAVAGALLLVLMSDLTYFGDNWALLMTRHEITLENLLHPHNEHPVAVLALIEMLSLRAFGMDSPLPSQVFHVAVLLATAAAFFVYARRRVGPWFALFATTLILFLGSAWETVLWTFEVTYAGSVLCGIGTLLALEREDRLGDAAACALLVVSLGFSSFGIPFIAAAAVAILLGPREAWLRRAYVFVVPALVFAGWYLGWGREAESQVTLGHILESPRSVLDALASAVAAILGLWSDPFREDGPLAWGRPLLIALAFLVGLWLLRRRGVPRGVWPVAAAAATSWFLAAFNGRDPTASRYQYPAAILLLMILANLFRDARPGRNAIVAGAVVTGLALGPNLVELRDGNRKFEREAVLARAGTAAVEIAAPTADPDFQLTPEIAGTPSLINVYAGLYTEAVDRYGSPAYSVPELQAAPEEGRIRADVILSEALPVSTAVDRRPALGRRACIVVNEGGGETEVPLEQGAAWVAPAPGDTAELSLRRFAAENYPVALPPARAGRVMRIGLPRDAAPGVLWRLLVTSREPARVCQ